MKIGRLTGAAATLALLAGVQSAQALDEITVAYFLEWPMPFEYAKAMGTYEQEMGVKINWRVV
jgi:taurine transport system substrate-binding protein